MTIFNSLLDWIAESEPIHALIFLLE